MKVIFISAPKNLHEVPFSWSHDLTVELAVEETHGNPVGCIDNAFYRLDLEVLKHQIKQLQPDKIVIYGGLKQYRFIKEYLNAIPDAVLMGFPEAVLRDLPVIRGATPPRRNPDKLPYPAWNLIPVEDYFRNSPLPWTQETLGLTRRATFKSQWNGQVQTPSYVARQLRYLKLVYNYDFISFQDDLSENTERTYQLIDALAKSELLGLFKCSCKANINNVNRELLTALRELNCCAVDYGEIDVTELRSEQTKERLQAAITATQAQTLYPIVTPTIGMKDTKKDDITEMVTLLKAQNLPTDLKLQEAYPNTKLYEKVKNKIDDVEQHILTLNTTFINYTKWTDTELLGIMELAKRGDIERLTP